MKRIFLFALLTIICSNLFAQKDSIHGENLGLIKWMTLKEAEEQNAIHPKAIMMDVYTDWCGWCKYMMATTFSDPTIAQYINLNFYPVRLNAESKDTIEFRGKKYGNKGVGTRPCNDLAIELLGGKMSYPTTIFFNNNFQFKLIVPGYLKVHDFEPLIVYTVEYDFNTSTVDDFRKYYFMATAPDTIKHDTTTIKWLKLNKAVESENVKPKKILMFINTPWCNSGRIMANATFRDSTVVPYINENFYPVYLDAESKDSITFKGVKYSNDGSYGTFHKLAVTFCNGRLVLPSTVIIDSNLDIISSIPQFYTPGDLNHILHFFAENAYKTMKWEDYRKSH